MCTILPWWYVIFSCFKQSPLNFILVLVPIKSNEGLRILFDVVGGSILLFDNPLDFHGKIFLLPASAVLKYWWIGWNTN